MQSSGQSAITQTSIARGCAPSRGPSAAVRRGGLGPVASLLNRDPWERPRLAGLSLQLKPRSREFKPTGRAARLSSALARRTHGAFPQNL